MDKCVICGKAIRRTGSNWIMTQNGITHRKCPKDKTQMSEQESIEYKSLRDRIAYHCTNNAKGYISENGMNFMRALQVVKQLHEAGYSYSEIEYTLDETVEQLNGFWGIKQVSNRIDLIVAKKRKLDSKRESMQTTKTEKVTFNVDKILQEYDEW